MSILSRPFHHRISQTISLDLYTSVIKPVGTVLSVRSQRSKTRVLRQACVAECRHCVGFFIRDVGARKCGGFHSTVLRLGGHHHPHEET
jgi:hypothetical protein